MLALNNIMRAQGKYPYRVSAIFFFWGGGGGGEGLGGGGGGANVQTVIKSLFGISNLLISI